MLEQSALVGSGAKDQGTSRDVQKPSLEAASSKVRKPQGATKIDTVDMRVQKPRSQGARIVPEMSSARVRKPAAEANV